MADNTTRPLQGGQLLSNQLELVTSTTVAGTLYGIAFTLFCLYVHALAPRLRDGDRKRQAKFMLVYSTVIMLCGLYNLVFNAWINQDAFIKHSDYRGGPYSYIQSSIRNNPMIITGMACQFVIDISTSAIQVWRVWVVWSATRYANLVIVLPTLCFLTLSALKLRTVILESTLPPAKDFMLDQITGRAEIALQGVTTILCTMLISLYLIFRQWQQRKLMGKTVDGSTRYMSIAAMIVESYVIESVWLLTTAILLQGSNGTGEFFSESVLYIEIIAYLLVQYRVANGSAYESQRGQRNISSLHWNHSDRSAMTQTGEIQDDPRSPAMKLEASNASGVSSTA